MERYSPEQIKRADKSEQSMQVVADLYSSSGYKVKYWSNSRGNYFKVSDPNNKNDMTLYQWGVMEYSGSKRVGYINYLKEDFGMQFKEAVSYLLNGELPKSVEKTVQKPIPKSEISNKATPNAPKKEVFIPPKRYEAGQMDVINYLINQRCINPSVVKKFEEKRMIYATKYGDYTNVCFCGYDNKRPAFISFRGITDEKDPNLKFRGNVNNSDKRFPFRWTGISNALYVFESPIDLMSFITMFYKDNSWVKDSFVALSGLDIKGLEQFLLKNKNIDTVYACLDNDDAGKTGNRRIEKLLNNNYPNVKYGILEPPEGKDWNENLQRITHNAEHQKAVTHKDSPDIAD